MEEMSKENKAFYERMMNFRKRYKDRCNQVKSVEEELSIINLEFSLSKNENTRLKEELIEKKHGINKYQKILQERVDLEEKYCKLLLEKKNIEKQLSAEKQLRLEQQQRNEKEKDNLLNALQEELRILKAYKASNEENRDNISSRVEENQQREVAVVVNTKMKGKEFKEELMSDPLTVVSQRDVAASEQASSPSDKITSSTLDVVKMTEQRPFLNIDLQMCQVAEEESYLVAASSEQRKKKLIKDNSFNSFGAPQVSSTTSRASIQTHIERGNTSNCCLDVQRVFINKVKFPVVRKRKLYSRLDDSF